MTLNRKLRTVTLEMGSGKCGRPGNCVCVTKSPQKHRTAQNGHNVGTGAYARCCGNERVCVCVCVCVSVRLPKQKQINRMRAARAENNAGKMEKQPTQPNAPTNMEPAIYQNATQNLTYLRGMTACAQFG